MGKGFVGTESLCWWCRHAVPRTDRNGDYVSGCEWTMHKAPVEGWDAWLDSKPGMGGLTYMVKFCPKYENDMLPDDCEEKPHAQTKRLYDICLDVYGVDIFPKSKIFWCEKYSRIRKPGMSDEEYERIRAERVRAQKRQWYHRNKNGTKSKNRVPYGTYSGRRDEYIRQYREKNRAKIAKYHREYDQRKRQKERFEALKNGGNTDEAD